MRLNINKVLALIFFLFLILDSDLYAVSLSPELIEKLRKEGRLEEVVRQANLAREKGVWQPSTNPPLRLGKGGSSAVDTLKPIVICVDFDDNQYTYETNKFDTLLFSQGFVFPTGSMRDYYLENSYGKLDVVGGVTGWYRMPHTYSYYVNHYYGLGSYPQNSQKLAEDAVDSADAHLNFADYDYNHDGWVDALIIVHAGLGAEETGNLDDIWSHKWNLHTTSYWTRDGVKLYDYDMDPETRYAGLVDMGVFGHEFGHILGLPDLYDVDISSEGLGRWSIMASGSWNNNGNTPAHLDAWCKYKLGWIDIDTLTVNLTNVAISQVETSPKAYRLWTSGGGDSQYFLVENRQKTDFDTYLPGEGLLIYHVDENKSTNSQEWCPGDPNPSLHYKVALEQADGKFQLEGCYGHPPDENRGDIGDPFPGSYNKRAFDDTTTPGACDYYDNPTQVAVRNISDSDSAMTCDFLVSPTEVEDQTDDDLLPHSYLLKQNYPNPFNPETKIEYNLSRNGWVKLEVFNILGQKICTLVDGPKEKGGHIVTWDGKDESGKAVSSGIYFYKLTAGSFSEIKRMVLLK
jgi:immune inhibitor A